MRQTRTRSHERGAALIAALAFLVLFSLLGGAYLRSAVIEGEQIQLPLSTLEMRAAAWSGIEGAAGVLHARRDDAAAWDPQGPQTLDFELAGYQYGSGGPVRAEDAAAIKVRVHVEDLSGLLNVNYAPASALQAVLGISGEEARRLRARLDEQGLQAAALDAFEGRAAGDGAEFLTAWHAPGHPGGVAWFNVNSAPPEVLAAVLRLPPESARKLAGQRPFANRAELEEALGGLGFGNPAVLPAAEAMAFVPQAVRLWAHARRPGEKAPQTTSVAVVWIGGETFEYVSVSESEDIFHE